MKERKNFLVLKLCACLALIAVFLHACRQEDFGNKTGSEATTYLKPKELKADDLLNNPVLYKEVQSLQAKLSSTSKSNTAGYTLETNRFIELKNNNRSTYTFTLTPNTKDDKLYNVAVSIGNNGTVESSVFIYNKQIQDNYTTSQFETLLRNNMVASSFDDFVNGPANSLIDPTIICIEDMIPVTITIDILCYSGQHTVISTTCSYRDDPEKQAKQYTSYGYSYSTNCTTAGGGGPSVPSGGGDGGGGGDTLPYGGGSGSEDPIKDNCHYLNQLKDKDNFKQNIITLQGKLNNTYESGFQMNLPAQHVSENKLLQNHAGSSTLDFKAMPYTFAFMHSHYEGMYPIFSPDDLIFFNNWVNYVYNNKLNDPNNSNIPSLLQISFTVITPYSKYVLMYDDSYGIPAPMDLTTKQINDLNEDYIDELKKAASNMNLDLLEENFLKYVQRLFPNLQGMKLYSITGDQNTEIYLNENNRRTTRSCN